MGFCRTLKENFQSFWRNSIMPYQHGHFSDRIASQSFKSTQAGFVVNDAANELVNTGVIVHDADADGVDCGTKPNQPAILSWLDGLRCWFANNFSRSSEP
jgi:hypothetical protein